MMAGSSSSQKYHKINWSIVNLKMFSFTELRRVDFRLTWSLIMMSRAASYTWMNNSVTTENHTWLHVKQGQEKIFQHFNKSDEMKFHVSCEREMCSVWCGNESLSCCNLFPLINSLYSSGSSERSEATVVLQATRWVQPSPPHKNSSDVPMVTAACGVWPQICD